MKKPMSTTRKIVVSLLAIFITIIALIAVLISLIFDLTPVQSVPPVTVQESLATGKLTGRIMQDTVKALQQGRKVLTITLSQEELNLLLNNAMRYYEMNKKPHEPKLFVSAQDEYFSVNISIKVAWGYLNLHIKASPEISGEQLKVRVSECYAGSIALPAGKVEQIIAEKIAEQKDPRFIMLLQTVKSLEMGSDGSMEINIDSQKAINSAMEMM